MVLDFELKNYFLQNKTTKNITTYRIFFLINKKLIFTQENYNFYVTKRTNKQK